MASGSDQLTTFDGALVVAPLNWTFAGALLTVFRVSTMPFLRFDAASISLVEKTNPFRLGNVGAV